MNARRKKSIADVTKRKGRTFMVVMGIFIGVLGLTVINFTQATIFNAYSYSMGSAANYPDVYVGVNRLVPSLTASLAAMSNVKAVQMQAEADTSWNVDGAAHGGFAMVIRSYPDLQHVAITPFQLTSGRYPGVGEIVLEYGDQHTQWQTIRSQIQALANVKRVESAMEDDGTGLSTEWGKASLLGFQVDTQIYRPTILSGRWLTANDTNAILINEKFAAASGLKVGQTMLVSSLTLTVIGIVHQPTENVGQIGAIITSNDVANHLGTAGSEINELLVQAHDSSTGAVATLVNQIDPLFNGGSHGGPGGGSSNVVTHQDFIAQEQQGFYVFYALLYSVALIVGVVGSLGLANALAASVLERKREIGMLRSMGGSSWRVAQIFWVEGLSLGSISLFLGAFVGIPMAYAFIQLMGKLVLQVNFLVDSSAFIVMLVAVLVIATLASIIPALRASRIRIADMLRYE
jgi:ABC-type lipoprotein release transport system permease subunit